MERQKVFRKTFTLTDYQIKRLQQLSELNGVDTVEHIRTAIDQYLGNQNFNVSYPKEDEIQAAIRRRYDDPNIARAVWLSGFVNQYEFSALILNAPAKSGLDKGRISKLSIWDPVVESNTKSFIGSCIVNYDRGWDIRPSRIAQPFYDRVKSLVNHFLDEGRQAKG